MTPEMCDAVRSFGASIGDSAMARITDVSKLESAHSLYTACYPDQYAAHLAAALASKAVR